MGADIHFVIEEKFNDQWVGVYSTSGPVYLSPYTRKADDDDLHPLGTPEDASLLTLKDGSEDNFNYHSHTYMPLHEFVRRWLHANEIGEATALALEGKNPIEEFLNPDDESWLTDDTRVVIWFDN